VYKLGKASTAVDYSTSYSKVQKGGKHMQYRYDDYARRYYAGNI
jgi:hypothetical protein